MSKRSQKAALLIHGIASLAIRRLGSPSSTGFHQLRNEFLTVARRVATATKRPISEVVEQASGGAVKYGDIGRLTEADAPKLRAALDVMNSSLNGAAR